MHLIDLSQRLLKAAKAHQDTTSLIDELETVSLDELLQSLPNDDYKKVFWINLYNAFVIILLKGQPQLILNPIKRKFFFRKKQVTVARKRFSLNDIEHGFLRKSRIWWCKGYIKKIIVPDIEKKLRVETLDTRIHFALHCGALGCPPIKHYTVEDVDKQLNIATEAFLFSEVIKDTNNNVVWVSQLFRWYIGDFGGKEGIINFLKRYQVLFPNEYPSLVYRAHHWQPYL